MEGTSSLEPLEHLVPKVTLDEGGQSIGSKTVSDPLERAGASSVGKLLSAPGPTMYSEGAGDGRRRVRDPGGVDGTLPDVRKEANRVPLEEGEAIVVGAIGSAAPWFLTSWAKDMEVEFMIDTGCQVTILATSVFDRMCAADPQVKARLRPCGRRLVSADSFLLTVKGELELTVVCCLWWLVLDRMACWVRRPCSCVCHINWTYGRDSCGRKVGRRYNYINKNPSQVEALSMTAVVLPQDSEIMAPFAVSGGRLGPCAFVEPSRSLIEEYGVVVGHTLVDASSWSASVLMINPNAFCPI